MGSARQRFGDQEQPEPVGDEFSLAQSWFRASPQNRRKKSVRRTRGNTFQGLAKSSHATINQTTCIQPMQRNRRHNSWKPVMLPCTSDPVSCQTVRLQHPALPLVGVQPRGFVMTQYAGAWYQGKDRAIAFRIHRDEELEKQRAKGFRLNQNTTCAI